MKLAEKIIRRIKWELSALCWLIADSKIKNEKTLNLSIGITTFLGRYESCFKNLIIKVAKLFPHEQIIVVVNGHFKKEEQIKYLEEIAGYCKQFPNVKLITHQEAVGLSKIWNEIVSEAVNDNIMILNDDLDINPNLREEVKKILKGNELTIINNSWSHFIISKSVFSKVGTFDEGLLELGGEDDDYSARSVIAGVEISYKSVLSLRPKLSEKEKKNGMNSYGKIMSSELNGYSTYNSNYLSGKWQTDDSYFEGAVHLPNRKPSYWKLKGKANS